ncbi:hypothetical protein Scep_025298 [Stephania cephalantha]|uniref:Homeobox-leucine zipper protein n=1 Tax=Stephania cephalantha TaxID=152367 RepID=A0AAP0EIF8_9MAGN
MMFEREESPEETHHHQRLHQKSKNSSNCCKRRFSDEQIKSMESIFESQTKLEPRKKLQLARELGLQPRQIAIWFQNRRARWKSKQLEREYSVLKGSYDSLADRFESLKKEKQSLAAQLKKLSDVQRKTRGDDIGDDHKNQNCSPGQEGLDSRAASDADMEERMQNFDYLQTEEHELMTVAEPTDGVLTSPETWCSLSSSGLFGQSSSSSEWWDFWA